MRSPISLLPLSTFRRSSLRSLFFSSSLEASSPSSPIGFDGSSPVPDPSSQAVSAAGSFQVVDGLLLSCAAANGGGGGGEAVDFGFDRAEFGRGKLVGTVQAYDRHVFLCYKSPEVWPSRVEAAESDRLPRILSAALKARKGEMEKMTRLTICEGVDATNSSNGDVLIFPDMIRYRRLTRFDVDSFVDKVLVKDTDWLPGTVETLTGSYVFVCAHGSRDRRCGVCGPLLIKKFKEEMSSSGLQGQVSVTACSHIGGHKYAGNVIIFSPNIKGEVTGHWYGYVSPDDVPVLLEQHIGKGEIVDHLWRGQMGLSDKDQKKAQNLRLQPNGESMHSTGADSVSNGTRAIRSGCCQGIRNSTCCQNIPPEAKPENNHTAEQETQETTHDKSSKEGNAH